MTGDGAYVLPARGDRVRDRNTGDELLVLGVDADTTATEAEIDALGGDTVAQVNPEYDPEAPVVEAVYTESVVECLERWYSIEDVADAVSFGAVIAYSFPADRLESVEETATGRRPASEER